MSIAIFIITLLLVISFLFIAAIHFYWFLGGTWGFISVIPKKEDGSNVFTPEKKDSFIMSIFVFAFTFFITVKAQWVQFSMYDWLLQYGSWLLATIFLLRAIGDFKYVGFFKKIKNSDFAVQDSKWFSPFCLCLAILLLLFSLLQ